MPRIISTVEDIPVGLDYFFDTFVDVFTNQAFWTKGTKIQILEEGPRQDSSSVFTLHPSNPQTKISVSFVEQQGKINVYYDTEIGELKMLATPGFGKMMKKMRKMVENQKEGFLQQVDMQVIPLITSSVQKTMKAVQKGKDETDKKSLDGVQDPLKLLKLKFVEGKISEEEYIRKKKLLEE